MNFRIQPSMDLFVDAPWASNRKTLAGLFALGLFLGIVAISMWEQWSLTFGLDSQLLLATSLVLSGAIGWGSRQRMLQTKSDGHLLAYRIVCLCAWSLLHPFWIEAMTVGMSEVPLAWLEQTTTKSGLALLLALVGWSIPGILWSSVIASGVSVANGLNLPVRKSLAVVLCGIAYGLLLNSLLIAPCVGLVVPTAVSAADCRWCGFATTTFGRQS